MANGTDIAKAYVQIIPSAEGIKGKLEEIMGGEADKAGTSAGNKFSGAMGKVLKVGGAAVAGLAAGATALTGSLLAGANGVAAYGDNIDKMSQKMGLSAQAYQEWDAIMQHSGTSIETMKAGMKTLANAVENGNGAFERIGLSMDEIAGMSNEELFAATISGLQNVENETERTYLAGQLLGRGATELGALLNTSAEDTEAMRQRVHELGGVLSDDAVKASARYTDSLQDMKTALSGAKNTMLSDFLPSMTTVMDGLTELFSGGDGMSKISEGINGLAKQISAAAPRVIEAGSDILLALADGIVENLPVLLPATVDAITTLVGGLLSPENISLLIDAALQTMDALVDGLIDALPVLIDATVTLITTLTTKLTEPDTITKLLKASWEIIKALATGLIKAVPQLLTAAAQVLSNLFTALRQGLGKLAEIGKSLLQSVVNGIRGALSTALSIGRNIVEGIWNGISNALGWIKDKISGWVGNVMSFIKRLFGISSPSRVMRDEVGRFLALGIGEGFTAEMGTVENMMKRAMPDLGSFVEPVTVPIRPAYAYGTSALAAGYGQSVNYGGVTIVIPGREKDADTLARELQQALERRAAVWA